MADAVGSHVIFKDFNSGIPTRIHRFTGGLRHEADSYGLFDPDHNGAIPE